MRVNLTGLRVIPKNQVYRYWMAKKDVFAHVYRSNEWIKKGFYKMQNTPLIWWHGIMDLLTDDEVDFAVRKDDF